MKDALSQVEENYLKAIFTIERDQDGSVSTSAIANELEVNAASVTDMIQKRLAKKRLVDYTPYQGVQLTDLGREKALQIVRKHRLWEVFLLEKLHFKWSEVHDIAEQLEHIRSRELIDRLDDFLGNPITDPHGDPIPDRSGHLRTPHRQSLSTLCVGESGILVAVKEDTRSLLEYLEKNQLLLGTQLTVLEHFPFDNSMLIQTSYGKFTLSQQVVLNLFVRLLS